MQKKNRFLYFKQRAIPMLLLVYAGEAIFFLPFMLARVFRPTLLEVFHLSNLELGSAFSVYGTVAMFAYFFGGPLADKFPVKSLMSLALATTAFGGILFTFNPNVLQLKLLYAFWGITSILLFWAALIKATRIWGGDKVQGKAFGLLDGGRGLVAALVSSFAVYVFLQLLPEKANSTDTNRAFNWVIIILSATTLLSGILIYAFLPSHEKTKRAIRHEKLNWTKVWPVLKMKNVWLQSLIILCAYVGYKITDDFSLFAKDALNLSNTQAASIGTLALWIRPFAAISAGLLADRFQGLKIILICFAFMAMGGILFGSGLMLPYCLTSFILIMVSTSVGVYGIRGIYFAIMNEGKVPYEVTGTAVGIISVVGYTPDIFVGPAMGYILDQSPGITGHHHLFMGLALVSFFGFITTLLFIRTLNKP